MGTKQILVSLRLKISSLVLIKIRVLFDTGLHRGGRRGEYCEYCEYVFVDLIFDFWIFFSSWNNIHIIHIFHNMLILFTFFVWICCEYCEYHLRNYSPPTTPLCNCLWQARRAWEWILRGRQKFSKVDSALQLEYNTLQNSLFVTDSCKQNLQGP